MDLQRMVALYRQGQAAVIQAYIDAGYSYEEAARLMRLELREAFANRTGVELPAEFLNTED